MRRVRPALVLGIVALIAAGAAAAATISSPLRPVSPPGAVRSATAGQEALELDAAALSALRNWDSGPFRIEAFPIASGVTGPLVLKRFEVSAPDARVTITGSDGETSLAIPSIAHFSGSIEGEPDSHVYVSAQPDKLIAYLQTSAGLLYVGPDESGVQYVLRTADSPLNERLVMEPWTCGQELLPAPLTANAEPSFPALLAPLAGLKQGGLRVETDQELLAKFGGDINAMASYVTTLLGAINVIYERDLSLNLAVSEIHAWTTTDPYPGPSTLDQLLQLGDWWHANRPIASYPRAVVHYLSGRPVSGGIAWVNVLCSGDFPYGGAYGGSYGLTQVYGTYPLQFWDQMATSHEIGHNVGSPHTHCYSPPIDMCYSGESGCYVGPTSVPPENGTIMSYCHLMPGGFSNIDLIFHARCISETMMPEIDTAACLTEASTFIDVPPSHPYFDFVETIAANGITGGCGGEYYCPDSPVSRAQMAVFLLKSKFGSLHVPPQATGGVFDDVAPQDFAADWIEELASLGITAGCTPTTYCPGAAVTREQMASFLLKTLYGFDHVPPAAASVFSDVANNDPFEPWIMELYNLGITGGCATGPLRYCPTNPNSRGEMAVFLVKTFNLQ